MKTRTSLWRCIAVAAIAIPSLLTTASADPYVLMKARNYDQTSASGAVATTRDSYMFRAEGGANFTLHLPGGSTQEATVLDYGGGDIAYEIMHGFGLKADLDAAFPNGTYTITGTGIPTLTFDLSTDLYPVAVPQLTNGTWNNGVLVINPSVNNTLNFSTFSTYATAGQGGHMSFELSGENTQLQQDIISRVGLGMPATATPFTSYTIPAGSTINGKIYELSLQFDTASTFDTATIPSGVVAIYSNRLTVWVAALANGTSALPAPTVTTQPASQIAPLGSDVTFTTTIDMHVTSGQPNSESRWYFKHERIPYGHPKYTQGYEQNGMTLTVHNITANDVGDYYLMFVDSGGIVTTNVATLTIGAGTAPSITTQPSNQSILQGQSATFTVVAASNLALAYLWSKDGAAINGATNASLTLTNVQLAQAGSYRVAVTNSAGTTFSNAVTLTVNAPPVITSQPASMTATLGGVAGFTVAASGFPALTYQWYKNGSAITGATTAELLFTNLQQSDGANYTVQVSNTYGGVTSSYATLTVTNSPTAPQFVVQPQNAIVVTGGTATFTAFANALPEATYQWFKGATALTGKTSSTLQLNNVQPADAGTYKVVATNTEGVATSDVATLSVGPMSYLSNVSVRAKMNQGQTLIMGFVVSGGSKPILVRAGGPVLNQFGLIGLPDPRLTLYNSGGTSVGSNEDWPGNLVSVFSMLGATSYDPGSKDAALLQSLDGPHTAHTQGSGSGSVIAEAYDAGEATGAKLVNVSARYQVGTGNDILIAGFVIAGAGKKQVLVRAVGPGLTKHGVTGVLLDPQVSIYDGGTRINGNDNWDATLASTFDTLGADTLEVGSKDAALLIELDAGKPYTAQVSGVGNTTGEALVEIYDATP